MRFSEFKLNENVEIFKSQDVSRIYTVIAEGESTWSSPLSFDKFCELLEAKPVPNSNVSKKEVQIRTCKLFHETLLLYPDSREKVLAFVKFKVDNFAAAYGGSDTMFIARAPIGSLNPGIKHAHITQNLSIVYKLHGKEPRFLDLYGIFGHKDLGTSTSPNIKQQKNMATKFANQAFVNDEI